MATPKVSYIFFDVGRVLLEFDHKKSVTQIARLTGLTPEYIWETFFVSGIEAKYERGDVTTTELHTLMQGLIKEKVITPQELLHAFGDIFTPKEDVFRIVESLKRQGFPLCLLSNTCEAHFAFFSKTFPIFQLFDHRILSYEVRAMKPETAMYQAALNKAQVEPQKCFYTDDIAAYVDAASALGIRAFTFENAAKLRDDLFSVGIRV